eukprot:GHVQ01026258.1.p1 GENE.GHVQ01026258.1~~GHVQ01026258.1.p1  ORF type:complete len:177 (+),score=33.31 GHVQ01026258.1:609-1139(+)
MEQDIALPLQQQTQALEQKSAVLTEKISRLTNSLRAKYDKLHPEKKYLPLVLVVKTPDDDKRAAVHHIDKKGSTDALKGLVTPCAAFHKTQEAVEEELKTPEDEDKFSTESAALALKTPEDRIAYDEAMQKQHENRAREIENSMKRLKEEGHLMAHNSMRATPIQAATAPAWPSAA